MVEYHEARTYVPTYCLVKSSILEKCDTLYTTDRSSAQRCFRPIWLVEYKVSGKREQTKITDSVFWVDRNDDSNQLDSYKIYEVFMLKCKEYNAYKQTLLLILNRLVGLIGVIIRIISEKFNGTNQVSGHLLVG
jgi:hypothetical protein